MALKPTIYKLKIALSDLDRNIYEALNLTIAQHPSETLERMMVRVLAYCINWQEGINFTKGLSEPDGPDICAYTLDDRLLLWLDVGEPAADRIKKATHAANEVKVYSFNEKSNVWWSQSSEKFKALNAQFFQVSFESAQQFALLADRTMDFSMSLSEGSAYISTEKGECEMTRHRLH